jgi:hypothetical protein
VLPDGSEIPDVSHGEHRFELERFVPDAEIDGDRMDESTASEAMRSR